MKILKINGKIDLANNYVIEEIQKKANEKIKNYIKKGIKVASDNETDIFGFGLKIYKNNPDYFNKIKKDWNKDLKNLDIKTKSDLIIKSISSTQNSVEVLDDKK